MTISPYSPLDSGRGEVRVLDLQPDPDYGSLVKCSMRVARLEDRPVYEALSYTWGCKGAGQSILLDGIVFPVFENLEAALRRLRRPRQARTLWIDALCINQDDIEERGAQVKLMRDVYEIATQVNVWLGEPTAGAEIGLNRLISSNPSTRAVRNRARHIEIETNFLGVKPDHVSELRSSFSPSADLVRTDLEKDEIRELLCRPWWNRVWIIQEAVVARKLKVLCGSWEVEWETLETETKDQDLTERQQLLSTYLDSELLSFSDNTFDEINEMRRKWSRKEAAKSDSSTLYSLLYSLRRLACTDPRDRVFAFLGLIPPTLRDVFSPNYSLPVGEIYSRFCKSVIAKTGTLDILNCTREWRGVSKPTTDSRIYSIYDRARYFDLEANVKSGKGDGLVKAPARLPDGWERCRNGGVVTYFDHNTQTRHNESPLAHVTCQPSTQLDRQRCPPKCKKVWDNLGRADIEFNVQEDVDSTIHADTLALPTWAPNWAAHTAQDPKPFLDWDKDTGCTKTFRATGSSYAQVPPDDGGDTLSLTGFQFDVIEELGQPWNPTSRAPPLTRAGIQELESWEALGSKAHALCPYGGEKGRSEALWRTHLGDYPGDGACPPDARIWVEIWYNREGRMVQRQSEVEPPSGSSSIGWLNEASNAERFVYECWEKRNGRSSWLNKLREMYDAWAVSRKYMPYLQRIWDTCAHRALFVTSRGYIGLAPWNAQLGDSICLLEGGKTPFLLRKAREGDYYHFVGECYVYGIMGGEAMANYSKLDLEIFDIQ
ncbi:heterokaryon incompatibility protein-domain-containing protein [Biscogniauxia sp. FL1348]|nr:heterokaryon incompatibility protein-domain-containing protein [Biscogniauxia sp. FL1348]